MTDQAGYMGFVGVSTSGSSIMKVFPRWAGILGLPTDRLRGFDLPIDTQPEAYRALVAGIRDDPDLLGALVTTHKVNLYTAAADLFDEIDEFGTLCGEISSISKRDGKLIGHAKDPVTAGLAVEDFLPAEYFQDTGRSVLCLGAGGAGTALVWYLAHRADRPARIICTDTDAGRLSALTDVMERSHAPEGLVQCVQVASGEDTATILKALPPQSLVVNASGLGKDRPGSPLPDGAAFPADSYVWEFNYRGSLEFLAQAREQQHDRHLTVEDGWRYFIHGWSQVVAEVFDVPLTGSLVEQLADAAAAVR